MNKFRPVNYSRLERLLLGPLATMPMGVRSRVLATIMLPPLSMAVTFLTLLCVTVTIALNNRQIWAWVWCALNALTVVWRITYPPLSRALHPDRQQIQIVLGTAPLFLIFGLGSAACIASRDMMLSMIALVSLLGIISGISSRWASLPRAAITVITLTTLPSAVLLILRGDLVAAAGLMLLMVGVSNVMYTLQNHDHLLSAANAEESQRRIAHTDGLTGLINRVALDALLAQACAEVQSGGADTRLAVLYLDLDGFKAVNDKHGHAVGDDLLRQVARILRLTLPESSTIARIGGDEFIVLLPGADEGRARHIADQVIWHLSQQHLLPGGQIVRVGCSIGISVAPSQGTQPEALLAQADLTLYASKHRGRGQTGVRLIH
jgi:diguanylate cyclase (GGDEF)-like protein